MGPQSRRRSPHRDRRFTRLAPHIDGAQGVIYDTALRGVHHQTLLRDLGLLPINRVTAAKANPKNPRRAERRVEKSAYIEDKTITLDGREHTLALYARGGAVGIGELTETGDLTFTELPRIRTHRNRDKNGKYRWYNDYQLPDRYENQTITVRLHGNADDVARKFNRTENVRPIPPSDPDFARLYPRRNDAESINRNIEDTLWIGRAHSIGHARQHLNLLGYALMVNGLALHRHQRRRAAARRLTAARAHHRRPQVPTSARPHPTRSACSNTAPAENGSQGADSSPTIGPGPRFSAGYSPTPALVAQGIEHRPPEPCAEVRILPRAPTVPGWFLLVRGFASNVATRESLLAHDQGKTAALKLFSSSFPISTPSKCLRAPHSSSAVIDAAVNPWSFHQAFIPARARRRPGPSLQKGTFQPRPSQPAPAVARHRRATPGTSRRLPARDEARRSCRPADHTSTSKR